jgi:hypothetical protein
MWCRQVRGQLSAYADGELSAAERRGVEEHLGRCEQCSREHASLRNLVRLTACIPAEEAPSSLHTGIMMRLAYAEAPRSTVARRTSSAGMRLSVFNPWMWSAATGAAAVLVMGLVQQHPGSAPPPAGAPKASPKEQSALRPSPGARVGAGQAEGVSPSEESARRPAGASAARPPRIVEASTPAIPPALDDKQKGRSPARMHIARKTGLDRLERPQPLTPAIASKLAQDPKTAEPQDVAPAPNPGIMAIVPDVPDADKPAGMAQQMEAITAAMDKDGATRMAGMPSQMEIPSDEDEGVRGLRMFLEERNKTVPQPPLVPNRTMRKL